MVVKVLNGKDWGSQNIGEIKLVVKISCKHGKT